MVLIFFIIYVSYTAVLMRYHMYEGDKLVHTTQKYSHLVDAPKQHLLIIGDSLGYGVGASGSEHSMAGLLAKQFPMADIENKSLVGEDIKGLSELAPNLVTQHYNKIFVLIGGNDAARYGIHLDSSEAYLRDLYLEISSFADKVYVYPNVRFDRVNAIPIISRAYYSSRSDKLYHYMKNASKQYTNFVFVDTYTTDRSVYKKLQASDGFHLNDKGIEMLFNQTIKADPTFYEKPLLPVE